MIATNGAVDVLRHGWQDAASTLAADVPEVAELLQARLEMAIATERLDERHLLDTIQEVESVTSRAGGPSSEALARRLRRTVYEYLLALDAARPSETVKAHVDQPATASDSPMVGAEEVAALGHASKSRTGDCVDGQRTAAEAVEATPAVEAAPDAAALSDATAEVEVDEAAEAAPTGGAPIPRRRFALRRRRRRGAHAAASDAPDDVLSNPDAPEGVGGEQLDAEAAAPQWQFTPPAERTEPAGVEDEKRIEPTPKEAPGTTGHGFVAPRAGFHIVEDTPAHQPSNHDEARAEMPAFAADELAARQAQEPAAESREGEPAAIDVAAAHQAAAEAVAPPPAGSEFLAWRATTAPVEAASAEAAPHEAAAADDAPAEAAPAPASPGPKPAPRFDADTTQGATDQPVAPSYGPEPASATAAMVRQTGDAEAQRGWRVRRHGDARSSRPGAHALAAPQIEDDPFENNSKLSDTRRRIEDRLRRKRCDEAAALLQEIAQETGGRAVAELAMNAGDRCRALGKSNAALNCYLAAARADPVYELPLSRLADICIDNQDTELAVSYLERIARLYRFRGEDKAALRMYRRIATIAPYREDVLTLLMNAQSTGQLE